MLEYKTVVEKAAEWNITPQHVQYLCRKGKIESAIKRAGAWFIPDNAPSPVKNTKSDDTDFKFVGTKSKIFNSAIKLFMLKGFGAVSLRDIAEDVGIRQSTIYNHFESKQEILNTIYDFYCRHFLKDRLSMADMELIVRDKSLMEIIGCVCYSFKEEYEHQMSDISKIIFQRVPIDERARKISKSLIVDESIRYVEAVFDIAIEKGRFAPFNSHLLAVFISSFRVFTLYNWIVDTPSQDMAALAADEQVLYKCAASFITDLTPTRHE